MRYREYGRIVKVYTWFRMLGVPGDPGDGEPRGFTWPGNVKDRHRSEMATPSICTVPSGCRARYAWLSFTRLEPSCGSKEQMS